MPSLEQSVLAATGGPAAGNPVARPLVVLPVSGVQNATAVFLLLNTAFRLNVAVRATINRWMPRYVADARRLAEVGGGEITATGMGSS